MPAQPGYFGPTNVTHPGRENSTGSHGREHRPENQPANQLKILPSIFSTNPENRTVDPSTGNRRRGRLTATETLSWEWSENDGKGSPDL